MRHEAVIPHFVLMTGPLSGDIKIDSWPSWMTNGGNPYWLEYNLPGSVAKFGAEVVNCLFRLERGIGG